MKTKSSSMLPSSVLLLIRLIDLWGKMYTCTFHFKKITITPFSLSISLSFVSLLLILLCILLRIVIHFFISISLYISFVRMRTSKERQQKRKHVHHDSRDSPWIMMTSNSTVKKNGNIPYINSVWE
jgi:heme/copper-type cytochrome/quinol oxidase subunit 2